MNFSQIQHCLICPPKTSSRFLYAWLAACLLCAPPLRAADSSAKPKPDVLQFSNGDKLTGHMDHETGGVVFFASDYAGMVQVPWKKLKTLHTTKPFAVIENGALVKRKKANTDVPVGTLDINGDTLSVATLNGVQQIPIKNVEYLVDEATFEKNVMQRQALLQGIKGSVTFGYSQVNSTYNTTTLTSGVSLTRMVPAVTWMPAARRTLLNFTNSYSTFQQSPTPTAVTNILHGSIEEDEYLKPRFYALEQAIYDKNSVEGLALQQLYGGGLGYTVLKQPKQTLDLSGTINYTQQQFDTPIALVAGQTPSATQNLIGATAADNYTYKFPRNILFTEIANINPQFNYPQAYTANVTVGATMPIFKNFGLALQAIDNYLNDPPQGFKQNSTQYTTGLTYTIP